MMFKVDSELMNVFETDWYKKIKSETSPGDNMRILLFNKLWLSGSYLKKMIVVLRLIGIYWSDVSTGMLQKR